MVKLTLGFYHVYLITMPGLIRSGIVFLGVLCFIYESIGYKDDFFSYQDMKTKKNITGFGLGYKQELLNEFFMISLLLCWFISLFILIALMTIKETTEWKTLNRFIHLGLGVFLLIAWICGILGIFIFRSNCCHVNSGLEYNKSPTTGYTLPLWCRCILTVKWRIPPHPDEPEISVFATDTWSRLVNFTSKEILSALPHDFEAHCLAHGSVFVMVLMYFLSFILV